MIPYPQPDEYFSYYSVYVERIGLGSDIFALLSQQPDDLHILLQSVSDTQANAHPAPGEWSIKEVLGHICDTERISAYRTLRIARGDTTPLPGFEQDDYVRATNFNARSLSNLIEEFTLQRRSNILCFQLLTSEEVARRGSANTHIFSARAMIYVLAGHVMHHIESLKTVYKVRS